MKSSHAVLPAFVLLPVCLAAQSVVSPAHFTAAEGNTYSPSVLGVVSTPADLLTIHEELQGTARTIRGLAFRLDGTVASAGTASTLAATMYCSTTATSVTNPSATFSANHGADKTQVASFAVVSYPAPQQNGPTNPFDYVFPFAQPFAFGGAGPLCTEVQIVSRSNGVLYFDYAYSSATNLNPLLRVYGTGCKPTGKLQNAFLYPGGSGNWPAKSVQLIYQASGLPNSATAVLILGGSNKLLGDIRLPFALPGTVDAPSGACTVYNDILLQLPGLTSAAGSVNWALGLSVNPFYNGLNVFGQVWSVDTTANAWHLISTGGVQHHILAPYPTLKFSTVYSNNSTSIGAALTNQGFVTRIDT